MTVQLINHVCNYYAFQPISYSLSRLFLPLGFNIWKHNPLLNRITYLSTTLRVWRVQGKILRCSKFLSLYQFFCDDKPVQTTPDILATAKNQQEMMRRLRSIQQISINSDGTLKLSLLKSNERPDWCHAMATGTLYLIDHKFVHINETNWTRQNVTTDPPTPTLEYLKNVRHITQDYKLHLLSPPPLWQMPTQNGILMLLENKTFTHIESANYTCTDNVKAAPPLPGDLSRLSNIRRVIYRKGTYWLSLFALGEKRFSKDFRTGCITIIQQGDIGILAYIDPLRYIRVDNITTTPPIMNPQYSLREKKRRLSNVLVATKKSPSHFEIKLKPERDQKLHKSRCSATTLLTESQWAWTIITQKGHAILILEGINNLGEPFTTKIHLMAFEDNGVHIGFVAMEDTSYWPLRASGRSETYPITNEQGKKLLSIVSEEAYVAIDPLDPGTYACPTLRKRPFDYGSLGKHAVFGTNKHNCISYILTCLKRAEVPIGRHWFDQIAAWPRLYVNSEDRCCDPPPYTLPPYIPPA